MVSALEEERNRPSSPRMKKKKKKKPAEGENEDDALDLTAPPDVEAGDGGGGDDGDGDDDAPKSGGDSAYDVASPYDKAIAFLVVSSYFVYPTISRHAFSLFRCKSFDDTAKNHVTGGHSYLAVDYKIDCTDTSQYASWVFFALVLIIVYVIGIPYAYMHVLRTSNLDAGDSRFRYGFLFKGYMPDARYWELFRVVRMFLLTISTVALADDALYSGLINSWIIQAALIVNLILNPFSDDGCARIELSSLIAAIITWNVGTLCKRGDLTNNEHMNNLMGLIIYGVNLYVVYQFAYALREELRDESTREMVRRAQIDFRREDEARKGDVKRELLKMKPMFRKTHPRLAKGLRVAFADDSLRDDIATKDVPSLRMKHLQLSMNLETLRNNWRETKVKGGKRLKRANLEELARERQRAQVPSERWREHRRKAEVAALADAQDDEAENVEMRKAWRERMRDTQWRVQQRLKYRLAEKIAGGTEGGGEETQRTGTQRSGNPESPGKSPGKSTRRLRADGDGSARENGGSPTKAARSTRSLERSG